MDTFTCTVDLNGEHLMVLEKKGVSPAELILLRKANGPHNVLNIFQDGTSKTNADEERTRLELAYGKDMIEGTFAP